jgi:ABC-2 type transport system permease protein
VNPSKLDSRTCSSTWCAVPDVWSRVHPLIRKELRQVLRSRGALISATLLPLLLLIVTPGIQLYSLRAAAEQGGLPRSQSSGLLPADLINDPLQLFARFLFPLFVILGGLIVPSVAATYTVVGERERRSLELLLSLPVRVSDILAAKLVAMVILASSVVLPLFAFDAAVLLVLGLVDWAGALMLLLVLLSALTYAVGEALLLALLARDLRTAQNLNGALLLPISFLTAVVLLAAPPHLNLPAVSLLLLCGAGLTLIVGLRWLTFERYLL